jgi:Uncharacterized protein conserved in bacteria
MKVNTELFNKILVEAKAKGACDAAYKPYAKALAEGDYNTAAQIIIWYYDWLYSRNIINISLNDLCKLLNCWTGTSYYENGQIAIKCNYKDGKLHGEYIRYYEDGQIKTKYEYIDNKIHGECIEYYQNGQIEVKCNYKDDKRHGKYIRYYENGQISIKCRFKDDNPNGKYIRYYENGKIESKCKYKDGKQHVV